MIRAPRADERDAVRVLFREYAEWVGDAICFESFEREVAELPGRYAPPDGRLLVAAAGSSLVGCVALRKLEDGVCEVKRLYVRPESRGAGLGKSLLDRIIDEARSAGYRLLRLDTLPRMARAIELYREFGFREIPPYGGNPAGAICFELSLL